MEQLAKLVSAVFLSLPVVLLNPFLWLVVFLVGRQESRMSDERERAYGVRPSGIPGRVLYSLCLGVLCGFVGSLCFVGLGISLDGAGVAYVWPLAVALMLVNQRFMCFAYAGGLLALSSLLFGWPAVSVPQLMCLVAVLHAVEAILIWVDGAAGAVPMVMRNKMGRAYGGFLLRRFWPVPVMVLTLMTGTTGAGDMLKMPHWWPIVKPFAPQDLNLAFALLPVVAALGYGDMAFTRAPVEKAHRSSLALACYSAFLLLLAIVSQYIGVVSYVAAVFAVAGHEAVIRTGLAAEAKGVPRFESPARGIMVLDVLKGSPAWKMGVRSGDIVRRANFREIFAEEDMAKAVEQGMLFLEIEVERRGSKGSTRIALQRKDRGPIQQLGILFVPKDYGEPDMGPPRRTRSLLRHLWRRDT